MDVDAVGSSGESVNRRRHFTKVLDRLGWKYAEISTSSAGYRVQPVPQGTLVSQIDFCFIVIYGVA